MLEGARHALSLGAQLVGGPVAKEVHALHAAMTTAMDVRVKGVLAGTARRLAAVAVEAPSCNLFPYRFQVNL